MKTIAFENKQYKPFDLVLYLLYQFPAHKVDPRIKPLLDKKGLIKGELLAAIENNLSTFKEAVHLFINPESKALDWTETSNLLAHLLSAQRKVGGVKRFGTTKSSEKLQALMKQDVINEVGSSGSVPQSIVLDQDEPASVVTQTDEFSLIVSRLKDNPNKDRARLDDLIDALKLMKGNMLSLEAMVRGQLRGIVSEAEYEKDSLMEYLMDHLKDLENDYEKEAVILLLIHLPKVVLVDLKDHYDDVPEVDDTPVTNMMKNIRSFSNFTEMSSVIMLFDEFKCANHAYLKTPMKSVGAKVCDAASAFIAATKNKDLTALGAMVELGLDDANLALLKLTESRKLAMARFLKINPEGQCMLEAKAIMKRLFGGKSMNAPLFCREIKTLLQQNRHADAIRLCAAADRKSFVRALLLTDEAVVGMLKGENNQYIALFSDKIKSDPILNLKSAEALSPDLALAARPKTVKLADWLGLFSVSAGGCSPDALHSGREQPSSEVANAFSNKN